MVFNTQDANWPSLHCHRNHPNGGILLHSRAPEEPVSAAIWLHFEFSELDDPKDCRQAAFSAIRHGRLDTLNHRDVRRMIWDPIRPVDGQAFPRLACIVRAQEQSLG